MNEEGRGTPLAWVRRDRALVFLLLFAAALFVYAWLVIRHRPGQQFPLGWWGFFDQGQYLVEAKAIAAGSTEAVRYQYPYGYPLLGVPFINLIPDDPFFVADLVCLMAVTGLFYRLCVTAFGRRPAVFASLLLLLATPLVTFTVVPWTTTPAMVCTTFWLHAVLARERLSWAGALVGGGLLGLTYLARGGAELLFLGPMAIAVFLRFRRQPGFFPRAAVLGGIVAVAVIVNLLVTQAIFGTPVHPYVSAVFDDVGFSATKVPGTLWGTLVFAGAKGDWWDPLLREAFWFLLAPLGLAVLIKRDRAYRIAHTSVVASLLLAFVTIAAFANFKAETLKFYCLHYLKPWFPALAFYAVAFVMWTSERMKAAPAPTEPPTTNPSLSST